MTIVNTANNIPDSDGRYVLVLPADGRDHERALRRVMGASDVYRTLDATDASDAGEFLGADAVVFDTLGLAVVHVDPDQRESLRRASDDILSVEPERQFHPVAARAAEYLSGYRDGVGDLARRIDGGAEERPRWFVGPEPIGDDAISTWGLRAVGVDAIEAGGAGIKVAVLDSGFSFDHPDFADRDFYVRSFIPGEEPDDGHGHGTHCGGTACGPRVPATGVRRYGVAHSADLYVGKVLSSRGTGTDTSVFAGIDWAIRQGCEVISMSLGSDDPRVSVAHERAGAAALERGSLIIAAAGNNADRPWYPGFVGVPANSPSVMAVGAVDSALQVASFSATSNPVPGGQVDIVGPGVGVFSSWLAPRWYATLDGTSMATPAVAGLAAVYAETTGRRGRDLWAQLVQTAQRLPASSADVGSGLAHAAA
ncbi:S8 family serine peptidase [Tsukamurella sp. NPDC003166]|uniref:S8 family serine peptidase n=1 Tax=Tsukamurella sp. NPDC003166 TaxID=3154444 RepID=UPI0033ADB17D